MEGLMSIVVGMAVGYVVGGLVWAYFVWWPSKTQKKS